MQKFTASVTKERLRLMMFRKWLIACACVVTAISLTGCKGGNSNSPSASQPTNSSSATSSDTVTGVEKVKPAPGTGNVQGKVLYNGKPVENIEVKLCEKFSQYIGGCSGKIFTARTDKDGVYVVANVEPKTYEALTAQVFDTDMYVFATSGIGGLSSSKYDVVA
ncbi:MAG: hypothetical protein QOF61_2940, partial [Acidobacteriota bacterium]|nr:hypothetical protein [Acidobacteriota bacterium]